MNERMNERMNEPTNQRTNEPTNQRKYYFMKLECMYRMSNCMEYIQIRVSTCTPYVPYLLCTNVNGIKNKMEWNDDAAD